MSRGFWMLALSALAILAAGQFWITDHVQSLENDVARAEIARDLEQERLSILKAEWARLTEPARIADQARRLLQLEPMNATQIGRLDSLPLRATETPFRDLRLRKPGTIAHGDQDLAIPEGTAE